MIDLGTDRILARIDDGIGWITLNNPARRNAIGLEMWRGLGDALAHFEDNPDVRVVVLRGAGGQAFASGADISEFETQRGSAAARVEYGKVAAHGSGWLRRLSKPLLACIEGFCIGGGLAVALSTDIRFATPDSTFGIPAARLGLGYESEGLALLERLVGPANAADIMFSARYFDAAEAQRQGLVNFVVARDAIEAEVTAYARRIAGNAPLTIRAAKAALADIARPEARRDPERVKALIDTCFDSADYREGRRAFLEKRKPQFRGE